MGATMSQGDLHITRDHDAGTETVQRERVAFTTSIIVGPDGFYEEETIPVMKLVSVEPMRAREET